MMDIQSALYSGVQGFARASSGVTDATLEINRQTQQARQNETEQAVAQAETPQQVNASIAQPTAQPAALSSSLVQLGQEERNAQANVKSIQTADEVLGTVIDIRV